MFRDQKTKEVVIDFRKSRKSEMLPLVIGKEEVERVGEVKFLGMKFSEDLS